MLTHKDAGNTILWNMRELAQGFSQMKINSYSIVKHLSWMLQLSDILWHRANRYRLQLLCFDITVHLRPSHGSRINTCLHTESTFLHSWFSGQIFWETLVVFISEAMTDFLDMAA